MKHINKCLIILFAILSISVKVHGQNSQFGVVLAGLDFGGTTYVPTAAECQYYSAKGFKLIRVPFLWEKIQPTVGGALDPTYLGYIDQVVAAAATYNMSVMIDMHNYLRYPSDPSTTSTSTLVTQGGPTQAQFNDVWTKIATHYASNTTIWGYDLMNEPHNLGSANWPAIAQSVVNAIRLVDTKHTIVLEGDHWSQGHLWPTLPNSTGLASIVDPNNNLVFEAHQYFDSDESGTYASTSFSGATPLGSANTVTSGVTLITPFVQWIKQNNLRGMVGEYGIPNNASSADQANWNSLLGNFLAYLQTNCILGTYWAGGPGWGNGYVISCEPLNNDYTDASAERPQMPTMMNYTSFPSGCTPIGGGPPNPVTVSITSPSTTGSLVLGNNITITASASTTSGSISQVSFYEGNVLIGTSTSSPYSVTWTPTAQGSYSITAVATGSPSLSATSPAITINVIEPVYATSTAPTIDGVAEALWNNYPASNINNVIQGTVSSSTYLSANWKATWDATNLYVLVTVTDNMLVNNNQAGVYNDDGIELYIDIGNTKTTTYGANQFQYEFRWNDTKIYSSGNNATTGIKLGQTSQGITAGCTNKCAAQGYTMEIAIPWTTLGTTAPAKGTLEGFDVAVNDDDDGTRDAKIAWSMTTDNDYQDPALFGTVIMEPNPCTPPPATITAAGATSFCAGGSVVLNANTGTGYTYQWNNNGAVISGATASSYTATTSATYTVVVTSNNCQGTSAGTTVTVNTVSPVITPAGPTSFNAGGSVTLNANTGTEITYQWYNNGAPINGATAASYVATTSGTYTVSETLDGCSAISTGIVVNVKNVTVTITSPTTGTSTQPGNITITATATANGSTVSQVAFYANGTLIGTATSSPYTITWNSLAGGSFQIVAVATDAKSEVDTSAAITVSITTPIYNTSTAPVIDGVAEATWNNYPASTLNKVIIGTVSSASYLSSNWKATWDATNLYVLVTVTDNMLVNDNQASLYNDDGIEVYIDMGNTKTTTYGTNQFQYVFRWNDTKVYENQHNATTGVKLGQTSQGITAGCTNNCAAQGYTIEASIPWTTLGVTKAPVVGALEGFDVMVNDDDDGTRDAKISWNAASDNDYQNPSLFGTVIMEGAPCAAPTATITAGGPTAFCTGGSVVLNANIGNGYTYQWNNGGVPISGATSATYTASVAGTYTVSVKNSTGCVGTSAVTTVTINNPPAPTITPAGSTTFSFGGSVVLNANTGTGLTYQWYNATTAIGGATTAAYTANTSGSYTVTETNGCSATSSAVVVTVKNVSVTITSPTNNTTENGGAVTLTATAAANGSTISQVAFYANGALIGTATSSPYTIPWVNNTGGSYQIIAVATDAKSEVDTSAAITLNLITPVYNTAVAPVIDGVAEALWNNYSASNLNNVIIGTVSSPSYLSANWKSTWDANNVYFLVTVTDNTLVNDNQAGLYNDDGIEIYFDFGNTKTTSFGANQFQFVFRWNDTKVYENIHNATTGVKIGQTSQGIAAGCTNNCAAQGYTMEVSIPWTTLTAKAAPAIGSLEGFDVMVNDDDTGTRNAKISWNATSDNDYQDPALFGTIAMEGAPCTPPTATITPSGSASFCTGGNIKLTAATGTGYTYQWSNGGVVISGATSSTYTASVAGTYTVVVKNSTGCSATSTATTVTVNTLPTATITPVTATTFCSGQSVVLSANTGTGLTYQWNNASGAISGATAANYTATTAGTYTVAVTNANNCTVTSTGSTITVNPLPTATITPVTTTTFCSGGNVVLNANTGTGLTYQWYNGGAAIAAATASSYTANAGGSYTVAVTNANNCATTSTGTTVTVNSLPMATVTPATSTTFCIGGSVVLNANTGTGLTYQWNNASGIISGATTANYTANTAGTYTVSVTNANNCSVTSTGITVTVNPLPVATITPASSTTFCTGNSVVLNANTGAGLSYQWYNGTTAIAAATAASYTANAGGSYTVSVTNANNCSATSTGTTVTLNALPTASITPASTTTLCTGGNVVLNANTGTGLSYQWSNETPIAGATNASYTASVAGTYTVAVINANNCSATSAGTVVTVNSLPTATVTPVGNTSFCTGGSVVLNANTGTGLTYQWNNGSSYILGATGASYTANSLGDYNVTVTNSNNCTATSASQTVIVNSLPSPSISLTSSGSFCSGGSVTLNANTGAGLTYKWNVGGNAIAGATNSTYAATASGTYTVTEVNSNNCSATSSATTVTVNSSPTATINPAGATTFCIGGSVVLNTNTGTGLTYQWSNGTGPISGATNSSYTANTSGTYTVTITDASSSCSATSGGTVVTVNTLPTATITAGSNTTFCAGGSVTLNANTGPGLTYQWNNGGSIISGATSSGYTAATAGVYTLTVTNSNGCSTTSSSTTVAINQLPVVTLTPSAPAVCSGSQVTLATSVSGNPTYTYAWSPSASVSNASASSPTANPTANTTYSVIVTDINNCKGSASTSITVNSWPSPSITASGTTAFCIGGNVTLNANAGAGLTYQWNNGGAPISGATNASYTANQGGTYTVTELNSSGCSAVSSGIPVTVYTLPSAAITATGNTIFCQGGNVTLNASAGTGYTYQWNNGGATINGATNSSYTTNTAGIYTVSIKNSNGCSVTSSSTTVGVNSLPTVVASASSSTICSGASTILSTSVTGNSPYSYAWVPSSSLSSATISNPTATPSAATTYFVTVTDANGCQGGASTAINVNNLPVASATASGATTFCLGGNVTLNANAGAKLMYQWNNSNGIIGGATGLSYIATASNTYIVTVTDSNGCSAASNGVAVTANTPPTTSNAGSVQYITKSYTNLSANAATTGSGAWSVVSGTGVFANAGSFNTSVTGLSSGANVFEWTISSGTCTPSSSTVTINVGSTPPPQTIGGPTQVDPNTTGITYSVPSVSGTTNHWTIPAGVTIVSYNADSSQITVNFGTGGGAIAVTQTNVFGSTTNTLPVTVGNSPPPETITGPSNVTANSTGVTYSVPSVGDPKKTWTLPTGATITAYNTDSSQITVSFGNIGGNVSVTETNSYGSTTNTLPVNVGTAPATQQITGVSSVTPNETGVIYSVTAQAGTKYKWSLPPGAVVTYINSDSTQITVSFGSVGGNVIVTETNPFGSTNDTLPVALAQTTGVIAGHVNDSYEIYPNPFYGSTTIVVNSPVNEKITLSVIDLQGVTCFTSSDYYTNQHIKIGYQLASAGVYFVQLSYGNEIKVIKAVKVD